MVRSKRLMRAKPGINLKHQTLHRQIITAERSTSTVFAALWRSLTLLDALAWSALEAVGWVVMKYTQLGPAALKINRLVLGMRFTRVRHLGQPLQQARDPLGPGLRIRGWSKQTGSTMVRRQAAV
ncbi:hypothetical protein [Streptomyces sp. NPDC021562]|uniref:hypothetical protein n=1 Tax=Streptomyces sp. NPDC021562 TaxID=3155121 RepID=UPI001049E232